MKDIKCFKVFFAVFLFSALNITAQSVDSLGLSKENSAYIQTLPEELQEALVEELDQKLSLQQENISSTAKITPNMSSLLDKAIYGIDQRNQNKFGYISKIGASIYLACQIWTKLFSPTRCLVMFKSCPSEKAVNKSHSLFDRSYLVA